MRRGIAVSWHAISFLLAAILFFIFVLPRWWELMGEVSHGVGTILRIITGLLVGLTALPVTFNLLRSRKPEFGIPQLALTLRVWSIVGHVLAGVLIVGAAVSEIWLSLDTAGQWLFGVYGAAAAIAVLGAAAFYLAFVAELPPAPPKPLKPKTSKATVTAESNTAAPDATEDAAGEPAAEEPATGEPAAQETAAQESPVVATSDDEPVQDEPVQDAPLRPSSDVSAAAEDTSEPAPTGGRLRNRRPSGKSRTRRSGVAVSED
jgi:hypothetical protein